MITSLVWLFLVVCVFAIIWWGLNQLPLPPIVKTVVTVLMAVVGIVLVGKVLMGLVGSGPWG